MERLPIEEVLPDLRHTLQSRRQAVLTAPPGAGKTTQVPLALLEASWLGGRKVLMLEPRRLAARTAARYMAQRRGEAVGQTIGYRVRLDTKVGPRTRIEVVTDGILTRLLHHDPSLADYGLVIFDEFHERSLQGDLGLALTCEAQRLFRPDLRLLIMSATLEAAAVARVLGGAPIISSAGRVYPVTTYYAAQPIGNRLDVAVAEAIRRTLKTEPGSVLVFLPGMAEIRRVECRLIESRLDPTVTICPLHGDLPAAQQEEAIHPAPPGRRKVVLATSIAETSLTIEGVRVVIDAGLMRIPRFQPRTGLTRLDTVRVSQDAADQRRGRAGRVEPGVCYRLWTEAEHQALLPRRPPEILEADLTPLVLDLAAWGADDVASLTWLDAPPAGALAQARQLLTNLEALDEAGRLTDHGRQLAQVALHPRLAHMILRARALGHGLLACEVAALLGERDLLQGPSGSCTADLRLRLEALHGRARLPPGCSLNRSVVQQIERAAAQWQQQLGIRGTGATSVEATGLVLSFAYPDRVAQRLPGEERRYLLANGRGASLPREEVLASEFFLVAAQLADSGQWPAILLASPVTREDLETQGGMPLHIVEEVVWDERTESVVARRQRRFGALVLEDRPLPDPDPALVTAALLSGIRRKGLASLNWTTENRQWRARIMFMRRVTGPEGGWPDLSDAALSGSLDHWLGPFVSDLRTLAQVRRLDLAEPLAALLTWEQRQALERLAPTHVAVPSGSRIRLDYESGEVPVLAVKLQELFGCRDQPRLVNGRVPVLIHLLSPAGRPVQVTQDLASFWAVGYQEVKKELRGRYPKHPWPDDPLTAAATRKTKRQAH